MRHGCVRECSQVRPGALAVWEADRLVSAHPGPPLEDACQYYCRAVPAGSPGSIGGRRKNDRLARGAFESVLHLQVPRDGGLGPGAVGRKRNRRGLQRSALLRRCRSALHLRRHVSNAEPDCRQSHHRFKRVCITHFERRSFRKVALSCCFSKSISEKEQVNSMSSSAAKSKSSKVTTKATSARLFVLDVSAGRVLSCKPDGSDLKTIVSEGRRLPDGIVVDVEAGHIYWTNMGNPKANDGSIERADLDGKNLKHTVPPGGTFTAKQLQLDKKNGKLYWCDREGMRVMRCNLDGSKIETLVDTSQGDSRPGPDSKKWCVGIAVDAEGGKVYWTQKGPEKAGQGRVFRADLEIPQGQTPANRQDIEVLYNNLPEPIDLDLDLDLDNRIMYWTDRGDPPRGNTVNRAPMDATKGNRPEPEIVFNHLMEGIGLALDLTNRRMFLTDLAGSAYSANLDGSNKQTLLFAQGNLTGIAYAEIPASSQGLLQRASQSERRS